MRPLKIGTKIYISLFLLYLCYGVNSFSVERTVKSGSVTAVLGAFAREVTLIEDQIEQPQERMIEGIRFVSGKLNGRKVVVTWTGVGKVNAAMTTTLLIEHYKPKYVVFTGIAGGVNPALRPGDIVVSEKTAQHDMGTFWPEGLFCKGVKSRLDGYENPVFFPADPMLLTAAKKAVEKAELDSIKTFRGERAPKIIRGIIVTGDSFISSTDKRAELRQTLDADAVEMEGAAVAQICYQREIGYIVIRSISDNADEGAVLDKQTFYIMAARNSAELVSEMVGLLPQKTMAEKSRELRNVR
jgi:adenosylhomocysteine nucleosidase